MLADDGGDVENASAQQIFVALNDIMAKKDVLVETRRDGFMLSVRHI